MKKHFLLLAACAAILFAGCKHNSADPTVEEDTSKKGQVTLTIGSGSRTITPVEWSVRDCSSMTITFTNSDTTITKSEEYDLSEEKTYSIPVGTYDVSVRGSYTYIDTTYNLTGSTSNVVVKEGENTSVSVYVSLEKTSEGKGEFEYTMKVNAEYLKLSEKVEKTETSEDAEYVKIGEIYSFAACLTPISGTKTQYLSITGESITGGYNLTLTKSDIPSGYYYLNVSYKVNTLEFPFQLPDTLVEIIDDKKTSGEFDNTAFEGIKIKNIYVSNTSTDNYNGLIPSKPKFIDDAFVWLNDNKDQWDQANIYFVVQTDPKTTVLESVKATVPRYNITNTNCTDSIHLISVYAGSKEVYKMCNGNMTINNSDVLTYFANDTDNPSTTPLDIRFGNVKNLNFVLDDVRLNLTASSETFAGTANPQISLYIDSESVSKYSLAKDPLVTVTYSSKVELSNDPILYDYDKLGDELEGYLILTKTTDNTSSENPSYVTDLYVSPSGSAGVTVDTLIPNFEISGETNLEIADASNTYSCLYDGDELSSTTYTFEWFLNGKSVGTGAEFELNPVTNNYVKTGSNTLMVVVGKDGEYRSQTMTVTIKQLNLLYSVSTGSSVEYYRSTNPSSGDTKLSVNNKVLSNVFRVDNDKYYGFISTYSDGYVYSLVYFDGTSFDTTSYANYTYPTGIDSIFGGYYDAETGYLYFSLKAYSSNWQYYLAAIDTAKKPDTSTAAATVLIDTTTDTYPLYKSMFVKSGTLYGSTMAYNSSYGTYSYGNCISYRTVTFDGTIISLGTASSIDLITTVGESSETLAANHSVNATDFYYYNGNIYFLCKYGSYYLNDSSTNSYLKSLGYIGRLNTDGTSIYDTYKVGWTESPVVSEEYSYTSYAGDFTVTGYTPDGANGFWGPERIVAIKKDNEIIIEDYGIYIYSGSSSGMKGGCKGAFITVNLSEKSFSYSSADSLKLGSINATGGWNMQED